MRLPRRGWRHALPLGGALVALALWGPAARAFYQPNRNPYPPPIVHPPPIIEPPPVIFPPPPPHVNPPPGDHDKPPVHTTPEPGTMVLGLIGGGIAAAAARRKKKTDEVTG